MGKKLIVAPNVEPVTLAEAKAQLGITDTIQDAEITRHITAARQYCENYSQLAINTQTWEIALDCFPDEIELPIKPAQSIISVKYLDPEGVEQTMSASDYGLDNYSPRHWAIASYGVDWPSTYGSSNSVKVRYVAGFGDVAADVPNTIKQAILLAVGHWINFQSEAELGVSVQMLPRAVDQLMNPYRDTLF